jgi:hypothetical protein
MRLHNILAVPASVIIAHDDSEFVETSKAQRLDRCLVTQNALANLSRKEMRRDRIGSAW